MGLVTCPPAARRCLALGLLLLGLLLLGLAGLPTLASTAAAAGAAPPCDGAYVVYSGQGDGKSGQGDGGSIFARLDLATGDTTQIVPLGWHVNAIGYSAEDGRFYGVGRPAGGGWHSPRIVTIDPAGHLTAVGSVRPYAYAYAYAATVWRGGLYLLSDSMLSIVDVNPSSPGYLGVLRTVPLSQPVRLGDWDIDPRDGGLWGVAAAGPPGARVVRVDPITGVVTTFPTELPGRSMYGAALITPGGELYVINNNGAGKRWTYRLPLAGGKPGTAHLVGTADGWAVSDAAECHAPTPPAPSPSTPGPRAPVVVPTHQPPASVGPAEAAQVAQATPDPLSPPGQPVPPPVLVRAVPPFAPRVPAVAVDRDMQRARRWASVMAIALAVSGLLGIRTMLRRR
jgi:hypothetical protein